MASSKTFFRPLWKPEERRDLRKDEHKSTNTNVKLMQSFCKEGQFSEVQVCEGQPISLPFYTGITLNADLGFYENSVAMESFCFIT